MLAFILKPQESVFRRLTANLHGAKHRFESLASPAFEEKHECLATLIKGSVPPKSNGLSLVKHSSDVVEDVVAPGVVRHVLRQAEFINLSVLRGPVSFSPLSGVH